MAALWGLRWRGLDCAPTEGGGDRDRDRDKRPSDRVTRTEIAWGGLCVVRRLGWCVRVRVCIRVRVCARASACVCVCLGGLVVVVACVYGGGSAEHAKRAWGAGKGVLWVIDERADLLAWYTGRRSYVLTGRTVRRRRRCRRRRRRRRGSSPFPGPAAGSYPSPSNSSMLSESIITGLHDLCWPAATRSSGV